MLNEESVLRYAFFIYLCPVNTEKIMFEKDHQSPGYPWDNPLPQNCDECAAHKYFQTYHIEGKKEPITVYAVLDDDRVEKIFYSRIVAEEFARCIVGANVERYEVDVDFDREKYKRVVYPPMRVVAKFSKDEPHRLLDLNELGACALGYTTVTFKENYILIEYDGRGDDNVTPCSIMQGVYIKIANGYFELRDSECVGLSIAGHVFGSTAQTPTFDYDTGEILVDERRDLMESLRDTVKWRRI